MDKIGVDKIRPTLGEMKQILAKLGGIEEILINELKADAFSKIQEVSRIFEDANALQFAMKNKPMPKEQLQKAVQALQESFQALDLDFFSKSIALAPYANPPSAVPPLPPSCIVWLLIFDWSRPVSFGTHSIECWRHCLSIISDPCGRQTSKSLAEVHFIL